MSDLNGDPPLLPAPVTAFYTTLEGIAHLAPPAQSPTPTCESDDVVLLTPPPPRRRLSISLVDDSSDDDETAAHARSVREPTATSISSGSQTAYSPSTVHSADDWYHADEVDDDSDEEDNADAGSSDMAKPAVRPYAPGHPRTPAGLLQSHDTLPQSSTSTKLDRADSTSLKRRSSDTPPLQRTEKRIRKMTHQPVRSTSSGSREQHDGPHVGTFSPEEDLELFSMRADRQSWQEIAAKMNRKDKACSDRYRKLERNIKEVILRGL